MSSSSSHARSIADNLLSDPDISIMTIRNWLAHGGDGPSRNLFAVVAHLAAHPDGRAAISAADRLRLALCNTELGRYDVVGMLLARQHFPDVELVEDENAPVLVPRVQKEEPRSWLHADGDWDMCDA
jgi:hypothetical protein